MVVVFATPPQIGHLQFLVPLAKRLIERGYTVVWAISGDSNEPGARWREPLSRLGIRVVDIDAEPRFERAVTGERSTDGFRLLLTGIMARANDVSAAAAEAIEAAAGGSPIIAGVYDYFAVWGYVAMRRLGVANVHAFVSGFPSHLDAVPEKAYRDVPFYERELARLRAAGVGCFDEVPRAGLLPRDPALRVVAWCSPRLCPDAPDYVELLGLHRDVLPSPADLATAPAEDRQLVSQLQQARTDGSAVALLSMGTLVLRFGTRLGDTFPAFARRVFSTLAASALASGATVVASIAGCTVAELGLDEATLGVEARRRVIAMPYVPQPLLLSHGLVDAALTHGGANTFYEATLCGVPLIVCPLFSDQPLVAAAAARLGIGVTIETQRYQIEGALPVETIAENAVPLMLASSDSSWRLAAIRLAQELARENGLDAAEKLVLGS